MKNILFFPFDSATLANFVTTGSALGGAGKLFKCYDIVEKYFPQVKVKNA
jgi:hypothetical protein